ncbi:MAG: prolyl aminopeptidase [Alphaproteobacteria bacterium]
MVSDADWKYPLNACKRSGMLQVDQSPPHTLSWEEYGNPDGEPVMFLHGGPGGGCDPILSRFFDPDRYRVILFDQRGCGNSRPSVATDGPQIALTNNTTDHLAEDIVKLRKALNIDSKMHVFGGSWGSTLSLAYAIKHPETVETLILRGIFIGRTEDLHYMYQGNAATYAQNPYGLTAPGAYITYPEAWKPFVEMIPPEKRGDMMKAYKEIFDMVPANQAEKDLQMKAAISWSVWEGVISHLVPDMTDVGKFGEDDFAVCFAQIEAHYFANNLFLKPGHLIDNVPALANVPVHIVHGRYDQVCPLTQADILVSALRQAGIEPASYVKTTAGHSALERATYLALTKIMDNLPRMQGFGIPAPTPQSAATPHSKISPP